MIDKYLKSKIDKTLVFKTNQGIVSILLLDIDFVESIGHYVVIHTNNATFKSHIALKDVCEYLDALYLVKCHRAIIVNLMRIYIIKDDEIVLRNGDKIPLSRREKASIKRKFLDYQNTLKNSPEAAESTASTL